MGAAQTGSGKTAGFTLPLLQLLSQGRRAHSRQVRGLVLTYHELALQVHESVVAYGKHLPLVADVIFGGVKPGPQIKRLAAGVDVLVATPGRLLDLQSQRALDLTVQLLVLDEADRMLDMGFIRDIQKVMSLLPPRRQSRCFQPPSALRSASWLPDCCISRIRSRSLRRTGPIARSSTSFTLVTWCGKSSC